MKRWRSVLQSDQTFYFLLAVCVFMTWVLLSIEAFKLGRYTAASAVVAVPASVVVSETPCVLVPAASTQGTNASSEVGSATARRS